MTAGLAKALWTSTGRTTPSSNRAAAPLSATTSDRMRPWIINPTTATRTMSAMI
ncbi:hypothetical protein D3C80_1184090 [compost metagenome]